MKLHIRTELRTPKDEPNLINLEDADFSDISGFKFFNILDLPITLNWKMEIAFI